MPEYRRAKTKGATYFFTVNCLHRGRNGILIENIDHLRLSFRKVKEDHPFKFEAVVVLPFVRNGVYPPDWSDDPVHVRLPTAYDN